MSEISKLVLWDNLRDLPINIISRNQDSERGYFIKGKIICRVTPHGCSVYTYVNDKPVPVRRYTPIYWYKTKNLIITDSRFFIGGKRKYDYTTAKGRFFYGIQLAWSKLKTLVGRRDIYK